MHLSGFRQNLRARTQTLDVKERQQILRRLVKEILSALILLAFAIRFRLLPATHFHPTVLVLLPPANPFILCVPGVNTPVTTSNLDHISAGFSRSEPILQAACIGSAGAMFAAV
jgi:hypothetical protein